MYSLYESLINEKISLAYFGVFNDDITTMLIDISESHFLKTENKTKLSKKTSFLIAESFQNIVRHGIIDKKQIEDIQYNRDFYQISILNDCVYIISANVIENEDLKILNETIENLNTLTQEELRELKKKILQNGKISVKGGAGIGLIEMVHKSKVPLQKLFIPLTDDFSLMMLGIMLPLKKETAVNEINLKKAGKFYRNLVEDGTILLYKGDFSSSSNTNIIDLLNNNFIKEGKIDPSKLKNIVAIIEVMQNVSKHGKIIEESREGIFAVKELNDEIYIECSNFVKKDDYELLKTKLRKIKSLTNEEIDKEYKKKMAKSYLSDNDNAGLGLLEVARFTKNTFKYNFVETSNGNIFFTIKIRTI